MDDQEAPAGWRKSRRSASGNCVEVSIEPQGVRMRNSRQVDVVLSVDRMAFEHFLEGVKRGEFDRR